MNQTQENNITRPLMRASAVAERLGVSANQVYRMHHAGQLVGIQIGPRTIRWEHADVEDYVAVNKSNQSALALAETTREQIVNLLGSVGKPLKSAAIARRLGRGGNSSHVREVLSQLIKDQRISNTDDGYIPRKADQL